MKVAKTKKNSSVFFVDKDIIITFASGKSKLKIRILLTLIR